MGTTPPHQAADAGDVRRTEGRQDHATVTYELLEAVGRRVAFRHEEGGVAVLRGRTINFIRPGEKSLRFIDSADEFATILKDRFELDIPRARELWPAVCARHEELFGTVTA